MLEIKNNPINFEDQLSNLLTDFKEDSVDLRLYDANVLIELKTLIEGSLDFIVPQTPSEYKMYEEKKQIKHFELDSVLSFEFNFEDYSEEFFKKKEILVENPYIIYFIPHRNDNFRKLSMKIGHTINESLIFCVRKTADQWEMPLKAYTIDSDFNCTSEVELFSDLYFQLRVEKQEEMLNSAEKKCRDYLCQKLKEFIIICLNEDEELFSPDGSTFLPASFQSQKKEMQMQDQQLKISKQKALLFDFNLLYSHSIRC